MEPVAIPTVRDHLHALGECPAWVLQLGEAIQAVTGCDAALAALRARDLSSHPALAAGLAQFAQGWLLLRGAATGSLTPMQQETLAITLQAIARETLERFQKEAR